MNSARALPIALCCLALVAVAAVGCGGGGGGKNKATDSSKVPTATLPATLPQPKIINSGAVQAGGSANYVVKDGDTLAGIASRFGVSLDDLRTANPTVNAATLSIGQTIKLPPSTDAPPATPAPAPTDVPATIAPPPVAPPTPLPATPEPVATATAASVGQTYTVQSGDIPVAIAQKFGITVEALLAANPGIDPTNLRIGQVLIIPPKPPA